MNSELNECYYNRLYDDFLREQQRISNECKEQKDLEIDKMNQTQLKIISQFLQQILRIRNIKKTITIEKKFLITCIMVFSHKIFYPHTFRNKIVSDKGLARGSGMKGLGILLDGGKGHSNSYQDYDTYVATTGIPRGQGLDKTLVHKLEQLQIKPMGRKPKNIQFRM